MCRLRSPSVTIPTSVPSRTAPTTPKPLRLISISASAIGASGPISGIRSPACIRSPTVASRAPSRPPGCSPRKSSGENARCSISATASASPSASVIVVEVVGASPTGQASATSGSTIATSLCRISVESARPATPISGIANRRA